jgi:type II secretory pathway pseudopilin PulG
MSERSLHRSGFTLVESLIAVLVGISVVGTAWLLLTSTMKQEHKAQGLAAAAQGGAQLLLALEQDFGNIRPNGDVGNTVATTTTPEGYIEMYMVRRDPTHKIVFDAGDYQTRDEYHVTYRAQPDPATKMYKMMRLIAGHDELNTTFPGFQAQVVRFTQFNQRFDSFVRVSALLVGEEAAQDQRTAATKAKPLLVTALYRVPNSPPDWLTGAP